MAHYAKIDENNTVVSVHVVSDSDENGSEENAISFLTSVHGDISPNYWKKTSFGTRAGKHYTFDSEGVPSESADQTKAFRKNYAGIGHTYDATKDAFIPPRPMKCNFAITHDSWTLDEDTCQWKAPIQWPNESHPDNYQIDGKATALSWDEHKQRHVGQLEDGGAAEGQPRPSDDQVTLYAWDPASGTWSDSGFTFAQFLDTNYTGD
jgi:hypothetical protein|tara:strand:+ start:18 stop:638 length:621 start_codon:yes stop_codon:yes gene_type:complete